MKTNRRRTLLAAFLAATALSFLFAPRAQAEILEPAQGAFTDQDLDRARQASAEAPPPPPLWEDNESRQAEADAIANMPPVSLNSTDDDACHYARGNTLILHIFVNHTGGTWSASDRDAAGAKAAVAKQFYLDNAPAGANVHFDFEGSNSYWYYNPTVDYYIPDSGMDSDTMEDVLAVMGRADTDGDGWRIDDFSLAMQDFNGGWDNVIVVFEPKQTGRAWASYSFSRCALYTDDTGNVFGHEWGHLFGSCDEYVEGGHCNGTIDCGACQSAYLDDVINNGNCQLASCPSDVGCIMINNTFSNICNYTLNHWGWVDEDNDNLLDWTKRRTTGNNFVNIYGIPHNGYADWNNTTDGYWIAQQWNTWSVVGLRSPAGSDYDLRVYGENNHNYLLASSNLAGSNVDFVASDYNHDRLGNEHLQVVRYGGDANNYKLHWESGTQMLYPDGIVRDGTWQSYYVVRCWDVPLFGGESVTFTLDVTSGNLDLGMALFQSNGEPYHAGRSSAVWVRDAGGVGGTESWTYNVPSDDVYGLVVWSNSTVSGGYSIKIGPAPVALSEEVPFNSAIDLRLYSYAANASYWSFAGTRPEAGTNVTTRLFADENFQTELATSDDYSGVEFVAADYNPGLSTDYLRVIRGSGSGDHRTEWEHDADILAGAMTESWGAGHVGKVWDAHLVSGQEYFLREYHAGSLDTGIYLFSSADGDRFKPRNEYDAASNFRPASDGGEWFHYTAPATDWYGIYQIVNDESSGSYSLWLGRYLALAEEQSERPTDEITFAEADVPGGYWTVFATRPYFADNASIWLYGDNAYTVTSLKASDQGSGRVPFVVGDFNHNAPGTYYPRVRRTLGNSQGYDVEWESGNEALVWAGSPLIGEYDWVVHDVADVLDLYVDGSVPGGRTLRIRVEDLGNSIDPGIALFASNGAEYWATLAGAVASSDVTGTGGTEEIEVHFDRADWYGLVIWSADDVDEGGRYRVRVYDPASASAEDLLPGGAGRFDLQATSTNPFANRASLRWSIPAEAPADLAIFDLAGRRVRTLVQGRSAAGSHAADWDGADDGGSPVPSGIYFARLRYEGEDRKVKLVRSH
ncbi:MAG: FlgD immunoglobulin-like domain containing protein [Candidatus Eisenbacteria bacterium]